MRNKILLTTMMCLVATPALAGEPCRSAKDLVKVAQNFYGDNPDLTNIITPEFTLAFKGINGAADPTAILYRHEGKEEVLPIVEGRLEGFEKAANWSRDGEMCRLVDGELAAVTEGDSVEASMSFSFPYKRTDGVFSIDEIIEGAKDGSKVMNGLAPGGLGFAVPGLKALSLDPAEGSDVNPSFSFSRKGEDVSVAHSPIRNTVLFRLKDIKKSNADTLTIAGPYRLNATFKFDPEAIAQAEAKRLGEASQSEN